MKILFSCSKEMNIEGLISKKNDINFKEVYDNIDYIKGIPSEQCCEIFKTKNNLCSENQNIDVLSKPAIDLFSGISFRQIQDHHAHKLSDLMIFSALYGLSYGTDYISPFRYDYTMKYSKTNRKVIYAQINDLLKDEDIVYNLASNEFYNGIIHHNIINFEFYLKKDDVISSHSVASKKMRGQLVNYLLLDSNNDLELFTYDGYVYNQEMSNSNKYVYLKDTAACV